MSMKYASGSCSGVPRAAVKLIPTLINSYATYSDSLAHGHIHGSRMHKYSWEMVSARAKPAFQTATGTPYLSAASLRIPICVTICALGSTSPGVHSPKEFQRGG